VPSSRFSSTLNAPLLTLELFVLHVHTIRHVPAALKLGVCWLSCPAQCCVVTHAFGRLGRCNGTGRLRRRSGKGRLRISIVWGTVAGNPCTVGASDEAERKDEQTPAADADESGAAHSDARRKGCLLPSLSHTVCHPFVPGAVLLTHECSTQAATVTRHHYRGRPHLRSGPASTPQHPSRLLRERAIEPCAARSPPPAPVPCRMLYWAKRQTGGRQRS